MRDLAIYGVHLVNGREFDEYAQVDLKRFASDKDLFPALMDFDQLKEELKFIYSIYFCEKVAEKFELNPGRFPRLFVSKCLVIRSEMNGLSIEKLHLEI